MVWNLMLSDVTRFGLLAVESHRRASLSSLLSRLESMSNNSLAFTDSVICYKELIDKEETAKRTWKQKYGSSDLGWRPVEPFERTGASSSKTEMPAGIPVSAIRNPDLYRDTVGGDCLAGGTPALRRPLGCAHPSTCRSTMTRASQRVWSRKGRTTATARSDTTRGKWRGKPPSPALACVPPRFVPDRTPFRAPLIAGMPAQSTMG